MSCARIRRYELEFSFPNGGESGSVYLVEWLVFMGFFRNLFGVAKLDGLALAESPHKGDYAQIDLLARFAAPRDLDDERIRARWNRVLPRSYDASIAMLVKQGWLRESDGLYVLTDTALPFVDAYNDRLQRGKDRAMAKVRQAIEVGDCGEALDIRRQYE